MDHPWGIATVLVVATLAGCADLPSRAPAPAGAPQPDVLASIESALANGHDHSDPSLHAEAGFRAREVWRSDLSEDGAPRAALTELDIKVGHAFIATTNPVAGMVVLDLADPAAPVLVGRYRAGVAFVADVKVTSDGAWAFLATEPQAAWAAAFGGDETLAGTLRGASGPAVAGDLGVQIVDVRDPARPAFAGLYATADHMGYHMLHVAEVGTEIYVYGAAFGTGRMDILRFETAPRPHLVPVGFYQTPEARDPRNNLFAPGGIDGAAHTVHDMTLWTDPLDGTPLVTIAYWHAGTHFLDAADPANPRFLGKWDDFTKVLPGAAEYVKVTEVEGRRIAVIGSGFKNAERQGILWIVDATDLASPELIGTWELPGLFPTTEPLIYTTHSFEIVENRIYLAHYHAGVYVLDIGTLAKARSPEVLAFHVPAGVEPVPLVAIKPTPLIFDALLHEGYFYLADSTGGLRVIALDL